LSYFVEVKICFSKLLVLPGLKFGFAKLPIVLPSSHTCGKPHVNCWPKLKCLRKRKVYFKNIQPQQEFTFKTKLKKKLRFD
jgi:hypothetical protein